MSQNAKAQVLVTGFGPFPGVEHNPTADLAREVDGLERFGVRIRGVVLPVAWGLGPQCAIDVAREIDAEIVIGLGVAVRRAQVWVERRAFRACAPRPDNDGVVEAGLVGPDQVLATVDCERLAGALGAGLSDDAGRYVCNAWLYTVAQALTVPVGFVHVPPEGMDADRLLRGVAALC